MNSMKNKRKFNKIVKDIKQVKIQGAINIAKAALHAYFLNPTPAAKNILLKSRPTEPMMQRVLQLVKSHSEKEILQHFNISQRKMNAFVFKLIRNNDVIFTHCHSTNVVNALIYAKKNGKKFEVYITETRPLYQGRITALELKKAGIKVTMFIDSAFGTAFGGKKKVNKVIIGSDALINTGIINKVGSRLIAETAYNRKIPVYVVADSWKFTRSKVPIEQRSLNEVWDRAPKNIKIKNPAFEFVPKKYLIGIVTDLGSMKYDAFVRKIKIVL